MSVPQLRPILNRIPGELPKSKPEQHVESLDKLTKLQLLEIKNRQEKLLSNKSQVSKLPDKGKRIRDFYEKVQKELSHRDEVERAAELFSDLNIATSGQKKLANLEWTGQCEPKNGEVVLDSDDEDETNPLKIIAQSTVKQKIIAHIQPEKSLITEEDLREIESFKEESEKEAVVVAEIIEIDVKEKINAIKPKLEERLNGSPSSINSSSASIDLDPHIWYLFEKGANQLPQTEKFKPYKTTKSNVHDPEKEKLRKTGGKTWEITAATPPPIQHPGTKLLSLQDSVEIQTEYLEKMKKMREQQAEERLNAKAERLKSLVQAPPVEGVTNRNQLFIMFREAQKSSSDLSESEAEHIDSDEEVRDEEEERGGVSYVVYK